MKKHFLAMAGAALTAFTARAQVVWGASHLPRHTIGIRAGWEQNAAIGLHYNYRQPLGEEYIDLQADLQSPLVLAHTGNAFRFTLSANSVFLKKNSFGIKGRAALRYTNGKDDNATCNGLGTEIGVVPGVYRQDWFLGLNLGPGQHMGHSFQV